MSYLFLLFPLAVNGTSHSRHPPETGVASQSYFAFQVSQAVLPPVPLALLLAYYPALSSSGLLAGLSTPTLPRHHAPRNARAVFLQQTRPEPTTSQSCRQSANPNDLHGIQSPLPLVPAYLPQPDLSSLPTSTPRYYTFWPYPTVFLTPCSLHCLTSKSLNTLLPGLSQGHQPSNI